MLNIFHRLKYRKSNKEANQMLQNVFMACDQTPNTTPYEKINSTERRSFLTDIVFIYIAASLYILTLIAPLFFPHDGIRMSLKGTSRPLTVVSHEVSDSTFTITLDGDKVDFSESYMIADDDVKVYAISYNRSTNTLTFPYDNHEYNIYIFAQNDSCLHLLLTPRR